VSIAAAGTITMLGGFGIQQSLVIMAGNVNDRLMVSNGFTAIYFLASIASLIGLSVAVLVPFEVKSGLPPSFALVTIFCMFVQTYSNSLLRALHQFRKANVVSIIQPSIFNGLLVALIMFSDNLSVQIALIAYTVAALLSAFITAWALLANNNFQYSQVSFRHVKAIVGIGGQVQVGNIFKEAMYKADLYVVTWLLGSAAAGLYSVVLKIVEGFGRFVDAIGLITLPLVAKYNDQQRNKLTTSLMSILFPTSLFVAMLVAYASELIVTFLFGEGFRESSGLLKVGIFALPLISLWKLLANDCIGRGLINGYVLSSGVGAFVVIIANYFLVPKIGLEVVPVLLIVSYASALAVLLALAKMTLKMPIINILFGGRKCWRGNDE
jgi:O-antigen/teichoic acid export membrane protein